jgi:sugar (pentulose or hexulose) kinase
MSRDLILAIDNGTQSLRALLFDAHGRLQAKEQVVFQEPYYARQPGWAEQDPEVFWSALCLACQRLWRRDALLKSRVAAVALTTQRGTVVNVDANGTPLRPAMLWLDGRRTRGLPPLGGAWGALFSLAGLRPTVSYLQAEAEANWIYTHQPEIWSRSAKFLLLSGYLSYRLTGEYVDSVGAQVGYIPFDFKRLAWAADWDWKWRILPVQRHQLPELRPPCSELGRISARASSETGIESGLPLIAAAADKACEVIGSGSLTPDTGCLSFGTTATINVTHPRYLEAVRLLPAYPAAVPGHYTMEVQVYRGFWMVSWFKAEFGHPECQQAEREGGSPEALFDELLQRVPPGAMGLVLQPYWSPGLKLPGPEARGAIIGFGDVHTRAHLYRAILEGIGFALREGLERIERRTGVAVRTLRVSGGGSQSRAALQLTADLFGLPTSRPHLYETSGLGAAIDAAVGIGMHADLPTAVKAMTRTGELFEPNAESHAIYTDLYRQVYRRMYRRLQPLYERLGRIVGQGPGQGRPSPCPEALQGPRLDPGPADTGEKALKTREG